jgi:hypothetical protein
MMLRWMLGVSRPRTTCRCSSLSHTARHDREHDGLLRRRNTARNLELAARAFRDQHLAIVRRAWEEPDLAGVVEATGRATEPLPLGARARSRSAAVDRYRRDARYAVIPARRSASS